MTPSHPPAPTLRLRTAVEGVSGVPFAAGNAVDVLRNGDEIFPAMLEAIAAAREIVQFLTFVYWRGRIAERFAAALAERARSGVRVQVLLDGIGAMPMPRRLVEQMEGAGVELRWFRPVHRWKVWQVTHRTHRKILVCDSAVGFTGGVGIGEEWEGDARDESEWRDTHFRIRGPAIHGLRAAFLGNWLEAGGRIVDVLDQVRPIAPVGDVPIQVLRTTSSRRWSDAAALLRTLIASARVRLRITTAYFVLDETMLELLCAAAGRGVDVQVLLPGEQSDERLCELAGSDAYAPLTDAGVRIHVFEPTMLHAKVTTVDGVAACVGSVNFNQRSMSQDDEVCAVLLDERLVAELDRHFDEDRERASPLDPETWRQRGLLRRAGEKLASLLRPQL